MIVQNGIGIVTFIEINTTYSLEILINDVKQTFRNIFIEAYGFEPVNLNVDVINTLRRMLTESSLIRKKVLIKKE